MQTIRYPWIHKTGVHISNVKKSKADYSAKSEVIHHRKGTNRWLSTKKKKTKDKVYCIYVYKNAKPFWYRSTAKQMHLSMNSELSQKHLKRMSMWCHWHKPKAHWHRPSLCFTPVLTHTFLCETCVKALLMLSCWCLVKKILSRHQAPWTHWFFC